MHPTISPQEDLTQILEAAREMGGMLLAESDGLGISSLFTQELPLQRPAYPD
jgi:hypothetical protein